MTIYWKSFFLFFLLNYIGKVDDNINVAQGKMDAAASMIEKAIVANPTYAEAYNNLGIYPFLLMSILYYVAFV